MSFLKFNTKRFICYAVHAIEKYLENFCCCCSFLHKYSWALAVTSHSNHLASLSKIIILCIPWEGKNKKAPLTGLPGSRSHASRPCQGVSRACLCVGACRAGEAGSEAHAEGEALLSGAKPQAHASHPSHLWCHPLPWPWQVLKLPSAL